jgi:hypothetical protein
MLGFFAIAPVMPTVMRGRSLYDYPLPGKSCQWWLALSHLAATPPYARRPLAYIKTPW